jgi:hypothetical protein
LFGIHSDSDATNEPWLQLFVAYLDTKRRPPVKRLPWGLLASGIVIVLGAGGVGIYGYARATRFVGDSPAVRPTDVASLLTQAQWIAGICSNVGLLGVAMIVAGYVLWAHE